MSKFLDLTGLEALVGHVNTELDKKVDKVGNKQLSTEDFTTEFKNKLEGLDPEAHKVTVDETITAEGTNPVQGKAIKAELDKKLDVSLKGTASGLAELDAQGKVLISQLPSFVDDVVYGYYNEDKFYEEAEYETPIEGEDSKIYVDVATNKTYRWGGESFVVIGSDLAIGDTATTAGRGDWTKAAYEHSQKNHAPENAEENQKAYSTVTVGETSVAATDKTDTIKFTQGKNVTLSADAGSKTITIEATDTTYTEATQSEAGLMSGNDKKKLDEIESITNEEIEALFE